MQDTFFDLIMESSIKLTRKLLKEFKSLVESDEREEVYQQFLEANPVFLDPLAAAVTPKQRLGAEYVTDFVLKRLDNVHIAVEIEKPSDPVFTKAHDFSSEFFHAIGQVVGFQSWCASNVAYAQKLMPGISPPVGGILVIGRRSVLSTTEAEHLLTYSKSQTLIEIFTYDDLLTRATSIYANIIARGKKE
jgi:hypothetical protein